jgi:molybdopterin-guanine dinucleotide biosynthesis protein A
MTKGLTNKVTAVILVGGESRRMGEDKSLVKLDGKPLVVHVYSVISKVFSDIVISAHSEDYEPPKELGGLRIIPDAAPHETASQGLRGPGLGLLSVLAEEALHEWVFLVSCDVPLISEDIIRHMLRQINDNNKYDAIVPELSEKLQPTFALYSKSIHRVLRERLLEGRSGLINLLKDNSIKVRYIMDEELTKLGFESSSLMDIDTPEELSKLSDTFQNKER